MKKRVTFIVAVMVMASLLASCGSSRQTTTVTTRQTPTTAANAIGNPFGEVYEVPAAEFDTDEYFGATGIAYGPRTRMDVLQTQALRNAQDIVRQKMQHAYKGMIDDYSYYIGDNMGADAATKMERGGRQIIDAIVNDTQVSKGPLFSAVDDKGNVTCYVGIRVSKEQLAKQISDFVSNDEELKIRFQEAQFQNKMEEAFREFKQNN